MIVVSFMGFGCHPCGKRTVRKTIHEDVPIGMKTVSAKSWAEAKEKVIREMEKYRPHKESLEVWDEEDLNGRMAELVKAQVC